VLVGTSSREKVGPPLYVEALSEYLARHGPDEVTEAMNSVVDRLKEPTDPFVSTAARRVLERTEW
jgi:hypothetical protein